MAYDTSTWYLTFIPVVLAYLLSLLANVNLDGVRRNLGGAVRTRQDLGAVRGAILFNKKCAWLYMAPWGCFLVCLVVSVQFTELTFRGAVGHLFAFGVLTLPGGLWTKSVEGKFKAMAIDGGDPELKKAFDRHLVAWKQWGFTIPE
jgi:hypothetical protein